MDAEWRQALDCVATPLSVRIKAATSLLEGRIELQKHHLRSLLSTASEVLTEGVDEHISTWFWLLVYAWRSLDGCTSPRDDMAIVRLLKRVGPFVPLRAVAVALAWMLWKNENCLYEALEANENGREYIWEGIVRTFNEGTNLVPRDMEALGNAMQHLLKRNSPLVYSNDFMVCIDIVVREATDMELDDPRRNAIAIVMEGAIESKLYEESGFYRLDALVSVIKQWYEAIDNANDTQIAQILKRLSRKLCN
ncbi:hypothetical protein THRCLA_21699 [Thraustotheca clavata]|uniref:Uncharacterized protein n=1 Tax=Thraustotheca clavata TaxID=74557 RepID=A0A1V9ZQM9_9STRA|nr:hypothetical protein THRCLA_21699 [Thraustotheca clavata]